MQMFDSLVGNLMVPTILFFVLGLVAAFVRSDLSIPEGAAKFMSLYLLLAIGFKGGIASPKEGSVLRCSSRWQRVCCCHSFCRSSPTCCYVR